MIKKRTLLYETLGERLKLVRELTMLSTKEFCKQHDIAFGTFMCWVYEDRKLPEEKAQFIVSCLLKSGVDCSKEWLLYGKGKFPVKLK